MRTGGADVLLAGDTLWGVNGLILFVFVSYGRHSTRETVARVGEATRALLAEDRQAVSLHFDHPCPDCGVRWKCVRLVAASLEIEGPKALDHL